MKRVFTIFCWASLIIGIGARLYQLSYPAKQVFDEVYFPVFAQNLLDGKLSFDVHPPLGKMLIAIPIWLLDNSPLSWRIAPFLFGLALIALFGFLARAYFKDKVTAWIAASFVALDCMLIVYSRLGLMDGILLFMIFACVGATLWAKRWHHFIALGVLLGLSVAIKWIAVGVVPVMFYLLWRKKQAGRGIEIISWATLVYVVVVYLGAVMGHEADPWAYVSWWHDQAWAYQTGLTATHPWSSVWWEWALMRYPVLLLNDAVPGDKVSTIFALGNPLLWWSCLTAVVGSTVFLIREVVKRKSIIDHPLVPLLIGYYSFFLPWAFVGRVLFIYHYLPALGFALLILAYWLGKWWKQFPELVMTFLILIMALSVYFLPLATGFALPEKSREKRLWSKEWLYPDQDRDRSFLPKNIF